MALVPFVVERIRVPARRLEELARRGADVEAVDAHRVALPPDEAVRDAFAQSRASSISPQQRTRS